MHFIVDNAFWMLFPEAELGVIVARGITNTEAHSAIEQLLAGAAEQAAALVTGQEIPAHPAVAPWRQAYQTFGAKPSKFRSSIESLLRSAQAGRIRPINPLVDLYNTVSLAHMLPCGGEDLAAIKGDLVLTRAEGTEHFVPLGSSAEEPPQPGEVIYRDDAGAICRCWNWREADRTKLTETTTDAVLVIEALPELRGKLRGACGALAALVAEHLGGSPTVAVLSRHTPAYKLDY
jgi:DNA/RNA-binding domain of Phe-tRNA-synthetase-like protein